MKLQITTRMPADILRMQTSLKLSIIECHILSMLGLFLLFQRIDVYKSFLEIPLSCYIKRKNIFATHMSLAVVFYIL